MAATQKVSAFAVKLAQQGKHELSETAKKALSAKVADLHSDRKMSERLDDIAKQYVKTERNRKKRQNKKKDAEKQKKLEEQAKKQGRIAGKGGCKKSRIENGSGEMKPLSWHNAPKETGRRKKLHIAQDVSEEVDTALKPAPVKAKKEKPQGKENTKKVAVQEWKAQARGDHAVNGKPNDEKTIKMPSSNGDHTVAATVKPRKRKREEPPELVEAESAEDSDEESDGPFEHSDPEQIAKDLFEYIIAPQDPVKFFKSIWTKKPLHIKRDNREYYQEDDWFSTEELDRILREEPVRFGTNIDLTTYTDGKRETLNPAGRAYPGIVWDHYQQGCSVRLLNPQTYTDTVWYLLSTLQDLFGCMVGANIYLTPPGTQGFAPHFDDIEGFVMQLEGKKHWRVYGPRTDADIWALESSPNMTEKELGPPVLDCVLEPGDLLYFPRGAIHQAMAQADEHSLHITVSTHQKNTWSDLFSLMLPAALANATEEDVDFRESLPNDYLDYTGIAFQTEPSEACDRRKAFMEKVRQLTERLIDYAPVDGACDLMAKKFIHDSLPPCLDETERMLTVSEQGERWEDGEVSGSVELTPDTRVRLVRKHCLRIVNEQDANLDQVPQEESMIKDDENITAIKVYYNTDNARLYHSNDIQFFDIDPSLAPAVEILQKAFPEFMAIDELPLEDVTEKVELVMNLYDKGLVMTEMPLIPDDLDLDASEDEGEEGISNDEVVDEDSELSNE